MNFKGQENKRHDLDFIKTNVLERVSFFNRIAKEKDSGLSFKSRSFDTVFPSVQQRRDSLQNTRCGNHKIASYKSVADLDRNQGLTYRDNPTVPDTIHSNLTKHDSGFDSSLKVNQNGNDKKHISRSLLNIAFLSEAAENLRGQGYSSGLENLDREAKGKQKDDPQESPKDENDKSNGSLLLSSQKPVDRKCKFGNSKQIVERKKLDLKVTSYNALGISSAEHESSSNPSCYSPTYKSPTRKHISASTASFPPVHESPEEPGCGDCDQTQEDVEPPTQKSLMSGQHSKSDSHLHRRDSAIDPTMFRAYHEIRYCKVWINGSGNNLTQSSGALTNLSTSSDQYNERKNIIESSQETLEEFIEDDRICKAGLEDTELRRFKNAKNILDRNGLLIIKCGDKDGSTYLGYSLMVASNSSTKCIIGNISEYSACIAGGYESYMMLVDNVETCGSELNSWITHIERNETRRRKGTMKMIFIIKEEIWKYGSVLLQRYEDSVIDLSLPQNSLNIEEKAHLLRRHINRINNTKKHTRIDLTDREIDQISQSATSLEYFGLIGRFLSHEDNIKQWVKFFWFPSKSLYQRVQQMKSSNKETDRNMYFSLAAVYFFKGSLYKDNIAMLSRRLSLDIAQSRPNLRNSSELLNCSSNSRRRGKTAGQTHIDVSSYERLMEVASTLNIVCFLGKRINEGVRSLNGTFLREDTLNSRYIFNTPSIENAIAISIGQDYPQEVITSCTKKFFHDFVGTEMSFPMAEKRCIRVDIERSTSYETAIERLRQALVEEDFEYFISHPLIRDARFLEMFSEKWNEKHLYEKVIGFFWSSKRKGIAETLMNKKDRTGKSVLIYALAFPFFEGSSTEDIRSVADWVLCHKKWLEFRQEYKKEAMEVENKVIEHSCEEKLEGVYMNLVDHLDLKRDRFKKEWLFAAVRAGSSAIIQDILEVTNFTDAIYHQALENALSMYVQERKTERREYCVDYPEGRIQVFRH